MILVTGGTGLIGARLILDLIVSGKQVRAIKRKSSSTALVQQLLNLHYPDKLNLSDQIEWVDGDVRDYLSLESAMQGIRQAYHCAAMVSFDPKEKELMMDINVKGTANVVNASLAAGIEKLCFVSSVASLGRTSENLLIDETADWIESKANSAYAVSKYAAECEVWRGIVEGLNAVIVNPSIVLGLGDPKKSSAKLLHTVWKGNPFYTNGINAFVDVRDVSKAMIMLMESNINRERFIICEGNHSYRHVFSLMASYFNKKPPKIHARPWLLGLLWRLEKIRGILLGSSPLITRETAYTSHRKYPYSNAKIRQTLGFSFIPLSQSIEENCRWFAELQETK